MPEEFDQQHADERHRRRRGGLQRIRNNMADLLNGYYDEFPESAAGERETEHRIEQRLNQVQRDIDNYISQQRRK
jgi:hypothetical protein